LKVLEGFEDIDIWKLRILGVLLFSLGRMGKFEVVKETIL
jgi:hypothetical protein